MICLMVLVLPRLAVPAQAGQSSADVSQAAQSGAVLVTPQKNQIASLNGSAPPSKSAYPVVNDSGARGVAASQKIPVTQGAATSNLKKFIDSLPKQSADVLIGIYIQGVLALPVVQQPAGNYDYVSTAPSDLTQYSAASQNGTVGILAHNYLSGQLFFDIQDNQQVILVYGDGHVAPYKVSEIDRFQALDPQNSFSDFIDLSDPFHMVEPFTQVFSRYYSQPGLLVFQTCIDQDGNPSWGRLFIVGKPE